MTYRDILIMRNNLEQVNTIEGTNPKFLYAVSRNKAKCDSIIKHLDGIKKPSDQLIEYWQKLDDINKKFAETDEKGTVLYTNLTVDGQVRKAYKKVIGEGNPKSDYTKETEKLKAKYKADLDKYEAQVKDYNQMLEEEVPEDDFRRFWINLEIVPVGLNPRAMDGCLPFIKEEDGEEAPVENDKKEKKEKKT